MVFYATPSAKDQYEETQASLISLSQRRKKEHGYSNLKFIKRRGQDMYEYIRNKPEIYRNLHLTNKIGTAFDTSVASELGIYEYGSRYFSKVSIRSNNLGGSKSNHDELFFRT